MLEAVDLKKKVSKEAFRTEFPVLQQRLWEVQRALREARIPVVVLFEGWAGSGKGEAVAKLAERLDPRGFKVHAVFPPGPEDRTRPFLWRYWMRLCRACLFARDCTRADTRRIWLTTDGGHQADWDG